MTYIEPLKDCIVSLKGLQVDIVHCFMLYVYNCGYKYIYIYMATYQNPLSTMLIWKGRAPGVGAPPLWIVHVPGSYENRVRHHSDQENHRI